MITRDFLRNRSCRAVDSSAEIAKKVVPPAPGAPRIAECAGERAARHDTAPRLRLTDHGVRGTVALRRAARGAIEIVPPAICNTASVHCAVLRSAACDHGHHKGRRADGCRYHTSVG